MFKAYIFMLTISLVCGFRYEDDNGFILWTHNGSERGRPQVINTDLGLISLYELPEIYVGQNGSIRYMENFLVFVCFKVKHLITDVFPPFKEEITVTHINIEECVLPVKPLVELFKELNINTTAIKSLRISKVGNDVLPEGNYTEGLNLETLWIHIAHFPFWSYRDFFFYNPNFMMPLTNLTTALLSGVFLPALPPEMKLKSLTLTDAVIVPTWKDFCKNLEDLEITHVDGVDVIRGPWPKNCSQLKRLTFKKMREGDIDLILSSGINASYTNLETLTMQECRLQSLPHKIIDVVAASLKVLELPVNKLTDVALEELPMMPNLTHLDLSKNRLTGWVLFEMVKKVPALRLLKLGENNFLNFFCNFQTIIGRFTAQVTSLEKLWLNGMPMRTDCLQNAHFAKLSYLNMAGADDINVLEFHKLPRTNAPQLLVDLRDRSVNMISFTSVDYAYFSKGESVTEGYEKFKHGTDSVIVIGEPTMQASVLPKVSPYWQSNYNSERTRLTVLLSPIDCDCQHYWLALGLRNLKNMVSLPDLRCKNTGVEIVKEPLQKLYCQKYYKLGCIQRQTDMLDTDHNFKTPTVETIECHNHERENYEYPIYESAYEIISLNLSDNHMENLRRVKIMNTTKWIDLRKNKISRLDTNDTTRLFANPERRVWLSSNLIVCDCENAVMIDELHEHRDQIIDFNEITCIDTDKPVSSVTSYEVCQYGLKIGIAMAAILAILLIVAAVLLWRYRLQIKIYLYSRGWCLFCLSEDDIDSDRPYDAFLSFSHGNEHYVVEDLLPKLEGKPNYYQICVHYRDWTVGDWIPAQIMRSVRLSKRTIIVLSRSFVESLWGSLEFRYAMASAHQEGYSRLIILILDDVLSLPLDEELKDYLHYNTYLRCDDPWFWEKLRYTMPRQKKSPEEILSEPNQIHEVQSDEIIMTNILSNSSNLVNS